MKAEKLTLEQKASLTSGKGKWFTQDLPGLDSIMMSDGPHGLRKVDNDDYIGEPRRVKATCFPTAAGLACSWNEELIGKVAQAIAYEAKAEQVSVILGPGINMKRSPLCGRCFEYFSEDPYLAGRLGTAYVNGAQNSGVGTSLKHFAVNSQETRRFTINEVVSERALREIYLPAFEMVVKKAQPTTIMASYNMLNGEHTCESKKLLTDILRKEWGFKGVVVSDWHAIADMIKSLEAGCDMEMPSSYGEWKKRIIKAVKDGTLDEKYLDESAQRIINLAEWGLERIDKNAVYDREADHKVAADIAKESMVLLKNDGVLPFEKGHPVAVIGAFARKPRYQGGGSSHVVATKVDDILENIEEQNGGNAVYADGYSLESDIPDEKLIKEAVEAAKKCGRAVIFAGLPDSYESEGRDRKHMNMPESHNRLIKEVGKVCDKTVVVLSAGSPAEMPWLDSANGLLHAYLGGQALGSAIAGILFGDINPSGKLAETHPIRLEDTPAFGFFPGDGITSYHNEDIYVGYRWYDKKKLEVNFPFGYGLSYTTFSYDSISTEVVDAGVRVKVTISNTGKRDGKEIVEIYTASSEDAQENRPVKELKEFKKVFVKAGESVTLEFLLDERAFAYWDENIHAWRVPTGEYSVLAGPSSAETPLVSKVRLTEKNPPCPPFTKETPFGAITGNPVYSEIEDLVFQTAIGKTKAEKQQSNPDFDLKDNYTLRNYLYYRGGKLTLDEIDSKVEEINKILNKKK